MPRGKPGAFLIVEGAVEDRPVVRPQQGGVRPSGAARCGRRLRVEPDLATTIYDRRALDRVAPAFGWDGSSSDRADIPQSTPKDWALSAIRAQSAWALVPPPGGTINGEGVLVGHPDTGYTLHPEVAGPMLDLTRDRDILGADDDALDPLDAELGRGNAGHRTQTSSVIASRASGSVTGVARRATIVPIRTITSVVQILDSDVARAVDYARRSGCHVISMSLGGIGFRGLQAAIRLAVGDGQIVLAAAGNEVGIVVAPASYPECIAVAATDAVERPLERILSRTRRGHIGARRKRLGRKDPRERPQTDVRRSSRERHLIRGCARRRSGGAVARVPGTRRPHRQVRQACAPGGLQGAP